MKIRNLQRLRLLLLTGYISSKIISITGILNEIELTGILNNYSLTTEEIECALLFLAVTTYYQESCTTEYKTVKNLYQDVLKNSKDLFKTLEVDQDPIEAFALYVYLYRKGYLSYQHKFAYDSSLKDFPKLLGVDVVLGHGVCRSISSMFVDICREIGMDAKNVYVNVNDTSFESPELLSAPSLEIGREPQHSGISKKIIQLSYFGNHAVSAVSSSEKQRILDATNMVSYYRGDKNRLYVEGTDNKYVKISHIARILMILGGNSPLENLRIQKSENEDHSIETYKEDFVKPYDKAYSKVTENLEILEQFYHRNEELYGEIHEVSAKKYSYFKK